MKLDPVHPSGVRRASIGCTGTAQPSRRIALRGSDRPAAGCERIWGVTLESRAKRSPPEVLGIVSDLDGTLLRSDGSLSGATRSMLDVLSGVGVPLVVATARTPRGVKKVSGHRRLGRVVCANGAIVWDAERDEVVQESYFGPSALKVAVHRLREAVPGVGVALLSARTMLLDETSLGLRQKRADGAEVFSDIEVVLSRHRIAVVAVRHPRLVADHLLTPTGEAFAGVGVASFAGPSVVDIVPRTTTKAKTVAAEMASKGCEAEGAVVFGDMPNDLTLFEWAGWACAVANGHPAVLAAADEVVPSNDDDGVARTVQRLVGVESPASGLSQDGRHSDTP